MRAIALLALGLAGAAGPVVAQGGGLGLPAPGQPVPADGVPQSAVIVLDREELYGRSRFGQRVVRDIEAASRALSDENRTIERELEAEERELTARRDAEPADDFVKLAADFDARVVEIRRVQDAKARAITEQSERAQQVFFERANPVLVQLARETGALVILDRRTVIASADRVDITDLALERIDAALGDGAGLPEQPAAPDPGRGTD